MPIDITIAVAERPLPDRRQNIGNMELGEQLGLAELPS